MTEVTGDPSQSEIEEAASLCTLNSAILRRAALQQQIELSDGEVHLFERYAALLVVWNRRMNLTRLVRPDEIALQHILDSLMCLKALTEVGGTANGAPAQPASAKSDRPSYWSPVKDVQVADVGSGPGMPGIALAIVRPAWTVTLIESVRKKAEFLELVARELGLNGIRVAVGRAEELGRLPARREQFDLVTARAVAPLPLLAEYALPLVRVGGRLLAMKGADAAPEVDEAREAISALGGRLAGTYAYRLPSLDTRHIVVVDKITRTPKHYPRPSAAIKARPIGGKRTEAG